MTQTALTASRRRWLSPRAVGAVMLVLALALIAPHLGSGTELVRLRHALVLGPDLAPGEDWQPPTFPAGFKTETVPPDPYYSSLVDQLGLATQADDWGRAVVISQHLLGSAPRRNGGAIQSDLKTTHRRITVQGDGYCGDFVRVFTAMANAAGMTVRPWAFTFDGFGGHGHIWIEIWNRQLQAWQLVDVFHNYFYALDDGQPLSAQQTRLALSDPASGLRLMSLHAAARPGWVHEAKARDYLRRGLAEWHAPWGNNVQSVDAAAPVRLAAKVSRALEGLAAIATGLQPSIRMVATQENSPQRGRMRALRTRLAWASVLALAGLVLLLVPRKSRSARTPSTPHVLQGSQDWPRVCVVGPLPPPSGGMANQCQQLLRLLQAEGASVELVRTNPPYPPVVAGVPMVRAAVRLLPYLVRLWRAAGRVDVVHVLANSGWAWHMFAAPAVWIARMRGTPVVLNYRGGHADEFLTVAPAHVRAGLRAAALRITPSSFLHRVFAKHGLDAEVIPNVVDLDRFKACSRPGFDDAPHIVVARNLEPIYGLPTAIRALARLRTTFPRASMTIAGTGPQRQELEDLARSLGLSDAIALPGRIEHADMPLLYARADVALNPSTVDNMPNSILEAFACAVPVVSTDAGGVPDIVKDGVNGLLVPVGDVEVMADALRRVLEDRMLALQLVQAGTSCVEAYAWSTVRHEWKSAYQRAAALAAGH